jgi:hypothetical protein
MNLRTAQEVRDSTGGMNNIDDPLIQNGPAPPADADLDGMPDFWETGMGLNPNNPSDNIADADGDGYTNIEEYINDLALARLCRDYYNPVYPIPNNWADYNPSCCEYNSIDRDADMRPYGALALSVNPNPMTGGSVNIAVRGTHRIQGRLQVISSAGRKIAEFPAKAQMRWNGRDARGRDIAQGVYLVRLVNGEREVVKKRMVIIR